MRAIVAATVWVVVFPRRASSHPRTMRPTLRNAVAVTALLASLGSAGVLLVQRLTPGAKAQPPYISRQQTSLD